MDEMSANETIRLIDWLLANGHTEAEAVECVRYIAGNEAAAEVKARAKVKAK